MPKVTLVKAARKDIPNTNIKKGDSYYWWQFAYGTKQVSKTHPKRSQLTQSAFLSSLYDLQDRIGELTASDKDEFDSFKDDIINEIEEMRDTCQENLDNMPEHLQESSNAGQTLTERIEAMDSWRDEIDNIECDADEDDIKGEIEMEEEQEEEESDEEYEERINGLVNDRIQEKVNEAIEELQQTDCGL